MVNTGLPRDPAIPLLGLHPRELKTHVHTHTWQRCSLFIGKSIEVEKIQTSIDVQINKMLYIHRMEYYSARKRNEAVILLTT